MRGMHACARVLLLAVMVAGFVTHAAAETPAVPAGVSPGAVDRFSEIRDECPAFSWEAVAGTAFYELVAYELTDGEDLENAIEVMYTAVPGRAVGWTPDLERRLAGGGHYVWFVRAVFDEVDGVVLDASEWSKGLYFSVVAAPSVEEVEQALQVLQRYLDEESSGELSLDPRLVEREDESTGGRRAGSGMPKSLERSVLTAPAAIRGTMPDPTGEFYGLVGVSSSTQGAGVAVANTAGGADLVLDGSAQGVVDTELRESGIDRRSSSPQSFNFTNSGSGVMRLKENGVRVVTVNTDQDTLGDLQCGSGEVAKWSGSAWLCADDEDTGLTLPFEDSDPTAGAAFKVNNTSTTGNVFAIRGDNASNAGAGVYGWSTRPNGINSGVVGQSSSSAGTGVFGLADSTTGTTYGVAGISNSTDGIAVAGYNSATTGVSHGVRGEVESPDGFGVYGEAHGAIGFGAGVYGVAHSHFGAGVYGSGYYTGVYGYAPHSFSWAGWFEGDVEVDGTLSKSGGSFKIDHPLDPANKYLQHSFVESPDMMNIYNGIVVLDDRGEAWVEMPDWFEALNRDFRYQLTAVRAPGPDLFIAEKLHDRRFKIAGGPPGIEVSWQLTGIRHDPWAEAHRIPVETDKSDDERGKYLAPELYGLPEELGVTYELTHRLEIEAAR